MIDPVGLLILAFSIGALIILLSPDEELKK